MINYRDLSVEGAWHDFGLHPSGASPFDPTAMDVYAYANGGGGYGPANVMPVPVGEWTHLAYRGRDSDELGCRVQNGGALAGGAETPSCHRRIAELGRLQRRHGRRQQRRCARTHRFHGRRATGAPPSGSAARSRSYVSTGIRSRRSRSRRTTSGPSARRAGTLIMLR